MKTKILLLYLNTGGGHLAPAKAIAKSLNKKYGENVEPILINGFEKTNKLIKLIVEDGYGFAQTNVKWFYEMLYGINKINFFGKSTINTVSYFSKEYLQQIIVDEKPDKILILHAFLIKPVHEIINELGLKISVLTLVTDPFSPAPLWFFNKNMHYIMYSHEINNKKLLNDIDKNHIHCFPFPLDEKFSRNLSSDEINTIRAKYGFLLDKKLVLIIGGADGIPKGKKILKKLLKKNKDIQVAIVCGRNKKLMQKASKLKDKLNLTNLTIYGYIDFVYELVNISDIVITKGGTSTIMEILISGKVPIINDYIWEQEKGNVEFVTHNNLGLYESNPERIADFVFNMSQENNQFKLLKKNHSKLSIENGTDQISKFIYEFSA